MLDTPVGVTTALPTAVIVPAEAVSALPDGKAVLPISTEAVPIDISNSGSLAATTVSCESPVIEKVPMDEVN